MVRGGGAQVVYAMSNCAIVLGRLLLKYFYFLNSISFAHAVFMNATQAQRMAYSIGPSIMNIDATHNANWA